MVFSFISKSPRVLPVPGYSPGTGFSLYSRQSESKLCVYGYPYGDSNNTGYETKKKRVVNGDD